MGPSTLEIKNAGVVLEMLSTMEDISYEVLREDIFRVTQSETGVSCVVDVEETLVCIISEVCDLTLTEKHSKLLHFLLECNNAAVHGKFAILNNKLVCKENLEIENMDKNELEAAIGWVLITVAKNIEKISDLLTQGISGTQV